MESRLIGFIRWASWHPLTTIAWIIQLVIIFWFGIMLGQAAAPGPIEPTPREFLRVIGLFLLAAGFGWLAYRREVRRASR